MVQLEVKTCLSVCLTDWLTDRSEVLENVKDNQLGEKCPSFLQPEGESNCTSNKVQDVI